MIRPAARIFLAGLAAGLAFAAHGEPPLVRAVDLGGLETRTAALMLSSQDAGDLELSVVAIPLPAEGGKSRVLLQATVEGTSLLAGVAPGQPAMVQEIYAYALDHDGALAGTLTQAFQLDLPRLRPALEAGVLRFFGTLDLPPGSYSLRVLAFHRQADRIGLRILPIAVPAWSDTTLAAASRRELARDAVVVVAPGMDRPPFPVTVSGESWVPSGGAAVTAGEDLPYFVFGRGLGALKAELVADGAETVELGLGDLRRASGGPSGVETLAAELSGSDFLLGDYRLEISDSVTGAGLQAPLRVLSPDAAAPTEAELAAAQVEPPRRKIRGRHEALQRAYGEILGRLAAGDGQAARRALMVLEGREIGTGSSGEQKRLADAELELAAQLASPDVEVLVPLMALHEQLYRTYHRTRRYLLATHSRQVLVRLGELYAEHSSDPDALSLVADALVSLGGYLLDVGSKMSAESAYEGALDVDSQHPAALIGLAAVRESFADYESAAKLLRRLSDQQPTNPEVTLRLAINLARLDGERRAIRLLEQILAAPETGWVSAVAAQELARLHEARKRPAEAVAVLEDAVERMPEVQRLKVQLASLLDRTGQTARARDTLETLDVEAGREEASPRLRYSRRPRSALDGARRNLAHQADRRLPNLRAAHQSLGDA